jgi:GNAT superfamily N-acetyltransferase
MNFELVPLSKEHPVKQFDCGKAPLNEYLKRYALKNDKLSIGKTFLALERRVPAPAVAGFITLASAQIDAANFGESVSVKLPRYPVPALRIARLAVDTRFQGRGAGAWLLKQAFLKALQIADIAGLFAVLVDAKDEDAKRFYEKYGFSAFEKEPLTLFLTLETLRKSMKE